MSVCLHVRVRACVRARGGLFSERIRSVLRVRVRLSAPLLPIDALFKRLPPSPPQGEQQRQRPITMPLQPSEEAVYGAAALIRLMN